MAWLLLLVLVLLNGVFAMAEMALASSRQARLQARVDQGERGAQAALKLYQRPGVFLSTVQVGITLIGILTGTLNDVLAEPLVAGLGMAPGLAAFLVVLVTMYITLVLGELVPKRLALLEPEQIAATVAGPMSLLSLLTTPFVRLLNGTTDLVLAVLGLRGAMPAETTDAEILAMIEQGIASGEFDASEHGLVEAVFQLDRYTIAEVFTPRTAIVGLDVADSVETIRQTLINHHYSSYPVYRGDLDDTLGVVQSRDLLAMVLQQGAGEIDLGSILEKPLFLPETATLAVALEAFRKAAVHVALVINEFGGVEGLVTLLDLIEALVGDMDDEEPEAVQREDGSWSLDGLLAARKLPGILDGFEAPTGQAHTLAGLLIETLNAVPHTGNTVQIGGYRFEIVDMDGRRVDRVLATRLRDDDSAVS
jgi:putative hemolysin